MRGGHGFSGGRHYGRYHGGGHGLFAVIRGVALMADIASTVARASAHDRPPPPPPPPPIYQPTLHGTLVLPEHPNTWLPVMRVGLKPANQEGAMFLAYAACNHAGQFSFILPPAGNYQLEVVDPYYEGQLVFATDSLSDLPLIMPITTQPR